MKGSLIEKDGYLYVIISYKNEGGVRKNKWVSTGLTAKGNKRAGLDMMKQIVQEFEDSGIAMSPAVNRIKVTPDKGITEKQAMNSSKGPEHPQMSQGTVSNLHTRRDKESVKVYNPAPLPEVNNPEGEILFSDFMRNWLKMSKNKIQVSTFAAYTTQVEKIARYFDEKQIKLKDLRPAHIQAYYQWMTEQGKSIQVLEHYHVNIRRALQTAVRADIIPSNPADKIDRPKSPKHFAKYYTSEQIKALFEAAKGHRLEMIIRFASVYGLRRSELMGLKWSAIDFNKKTIKVCHAMVQTKVDGKDIVVLKDRMKNDSSMRMLPLLPFAEEMLINLQKQRAENMKIYGSVYNHKYDDYIFVDELGGLMLPNNVSTAFQTLLKQKNLPKIRFHELRHSCASLLLEFGFGMKQIQEWLGHSTYVTTADIYSHLDFSSKVNVGKTIGEFFGEAKPPEEIKPDEILEVEPEPIDYSNGIEPKIIDESSGPVENSETETEGEINGKSDDEIAYEEYQEFLRWKKMMKKNKDMEM